MYKKPVGQGVMVLNQKHFFFHEKGGKYASIEVKDNELQVQTSFLRVFKVL